MAILKHIANKNANYTDALNYLLFQYDEHVNNPILDEHGQMMLREEYYLDSLNCEPLLFDKECERLNEQYHKNKNYDEIKSHHYIISFDPADRDERGLTGEKAQALGLEYARKNFPGHQALVCTHTDGHNGSGNIHVHIIINSLRKYDIPKENYMERNCDSLAGYKHHLSKDYLQHLQKSLMDICNRENLHQVDLLAPSEKKITDKEYYAAKRNQKKLDRLNEQILADGLTPRRTTFQTQKQYLRNAIAEISHIAKDVEDFKKQLYEKYQIVVTEHRGRFSYLHPEREKNITGRALGTHYEKEYLLQQFESNHRIADTPSDISSDPMAILFIKSDLRLVVDLQTCVKAQQSRAYAQKVKLSNLQEMAKTIAYVQEHEYDTRELLEDKFSSVKERTSNSRKQLKTVESELKSLNQQLHYTGQYLANKSVYAQFRKSKNKQKFRQEHSAELALYEKAVTSLKEKNGTQPLPTMKQLKEQKEKLLTQKDTLQKQYDYYRDYQKELHTICRNVDMILGWNPPIQTAHTKEFKQSIESILRQGKEQERGKEVERR